jgi:uncharacterized protein
MPTATFHEGERAVQRRAGVEQIAARVGRNIGSSLSGGHIDLLQRRPFLVMAGQDRDGCAWASPLVTGAGATRVLPDGRLALAAGPPADDPLGDALAAGGLQVGILAIEFDTRYRIRLNGVAERSQEGIVVEVAEAFGNCPKYIQRRLAVREQNGSRPPHPLTGSALDAEQRALVRAADTFFIASGHPQRGADASHRGGQPGFVAVAGDGASLRFPDYTGNRMFQTLGNIAVDPRVGLLVVDWATGGTLQVTGRAQIVWDDDERARWPGAERLVDVAIKGVVAREGALPDRWTLIERSPHNPTVSS